MTAQELINKLAYLRRGLRSQDVIAIAPSGQRLEVVEVYISENEDHLIALLLDKEV